MVGTESPRLVSSGRRARLAVTALGVLQVKLVDVNKMAEQLERVEGADILG